MQLEVRFVSIASSDEITEHVQRHVGFSLGRFYSQIERLIVRFRDVNGPRGGNDKVCHVEARGDFGRRIAEARGSDLHAVAARALDMLERSVARDLRRRREKLRLL